MFKVSEQESEEDELLDPSLENRVCDSSNNGITNAAYRADGGEMQFDVFTTECVKDGKKQSGAPESIFEFRLKRDAAAIGGAVVYKGTVTRVDTNSGERQEGVASFSAPAQTK